MSGGQTSRALIPFRAPYLERLPRTWIRGRSKLYGTLQVLECFFELARLGERLAEVKVRIAPAGPAQGRLAQRLHRFVGPLKTFQRSAAGQVCVGMVRFPCDGPIFRGDDLATQLLGAAAAVRVVG